jgi:hypothetical protein
MAGTTVFDYFYVKRFYSGHQCAQASASLREPHFARTILSRNVGVGRRPVIDKQLTVSDIVFPDAINPAIHTMIRLATTADAAAIAAIYNHYVTATTISFEEQAVETDEMARRIEDVGARLPWYVFERDGAVIGYAYATPWRVRSAYRF